MCSARRAADRGAVAALLLGTALSAACGGRAPPGTGTAPSSPGPTPAVPVTAPAAPAPQATVPPRTRHAGNAVDDALAWLARTQNEDGSWGADGDPGATGLALLAFVGAGETHRSGMHKATVNAAVRRLIGVQREDGGFLPDAAPQRVLRCALASLALTETWGLTGARELREPARRAASHAAGLTADDARSAAVLAMVAMSAHVAEMDAEVRPAPPPPAADDALLSAAASVVARMYARAAATPADRRALDRLYDAAGALCATDGDPWTLWLSGICAICDGAERCNGWRTVVYPALGARQTREGDDAGSWPPPVGADPLTDRLTATALHAVTLETCYRHPWGGPWAR